jgi:hypothetical protein
MTVYTAKADIPHYRQPNGSPLCGETSLKMIYGRHGIKKSIYDIRQEIKKITGCFKGKSGNLVYELGLHLLRNNFAVEIHAWPTYGNVYACRRYQQMNQADLRKELTLLFKAMGRSRELQFSAMLRFMKEGGVFIPRVTQFRELRERLGGGIIVMLDTSYHNAKILPFVKNTSHYVVLGETQGRTISLLDPYYKDKVLLNKEEFLFMLYSADATVLFVNGKK